MNWDKAEKIMNIIGIVAIVISTIWLTFMVIAMYNMIEDHNCYLDGYQAPRCQKYIKNK